MPFAQIRLLLRDHCRARPSVEREAPMFACKGALHRRRREDSATVVVAQTEERCYLYSRRWDLPSANLLEFAVIPRGFAL